MFFIDASDQVRVGRTQNYLEPEHVNQIYHWYIAYTGVQKYVKVASTEDLKENDFNLNNPLYVEKIIEHNLPSVEEVLVELRASWAASEKVEERFNKILKDFI